MYGHAHAHARMDLCHVFVDISSLFGLNVYTCMCILYILQCLEWLEAEYAAFILGHCQFHENPEEAIALRNKYSKFLTKLAPTCQKVECVLDLMSQLRSDALPLSPSIDKLCHVVSDRVKTLKSILSQCSTVLDTFSQFCHLYKEVCASHACHVTWRASHSCHVTWRVPHVCHVTWSAGGWWFPEA